MRLKFNITATKLWKRRAPDGQVTPPVRSPHIFEAHFSALTDFRKPGQTFELGGVTFTVVAPNRGFVGGYPLSSIPPSLGCVYSDALGVLHNRSFSISDLPALRAVNGVTEDGI